MKNILFIIAGLIIGAGIVFLVLSQKGVSNIIEDNTFLSSRLNTAERSVMSEVAATTTGSAFDVTDFQYLGWTVATTNASGTLKFACSMSDTAPTFSSSASVSNRWAYVDITDSQDDSSTDGNTGLVFTNSSTVRQVLMENVNFKWCTAILSPWTAGTTTVKLLPANNQ